MFVRRFLPIFWNILGLYYVGSASSHCELPIDEGYNPLFWSGYYYDGTSACIQMKGESCEDPEIPFASNEECIEWCENYPNDPYCDVRVQIEETLDPEGEFYGYDAKTGCIHFTFKGCGGNENSFGSLSDCEDECGYPSKNVEEFLRGLFTINLSPLTKQCNP